MNRNYRNQDLKILWGKSGAICAFPKCNQELIVYKNDDIIGNICHIRGLNIDSPRYDASYDEKLLNQHVNLILLCPTHHLTVDNDTTTYPVDTLLNIKSEHEKLIKEKLSLGDSYNLNLAQIDYINIPRIAIIAGLHGKELDFSYLNEANNFRTLGVNMAKLLYSIQDIIENIQIGAIDIDNISEINDSIIGANISFLKEFRTKNIQTSNPETFIQIDNNNLSESIIYTNLREYKLIFKIDPFWITTWTAVSDFSPSGGRIKFTGLATIKYFNSVDKIIIATPLIIGIPRNPIMDAIFGE